MNPFDPFTGFGDDPNTSVKFTILQDGGILADWAGGARIARFSIPNGGTITQTVGRDPWSVTWRLRFASVADLAELDALQGTSATLRYTAGVTSTAGGTVETRLGARYLKLSDTLLTGIENRSMRRDGSVIADVSFERTYVAPVAVTVGPYPATPPSPKPLTALNVITEWWISPIATYQTSPYERTVTGGIASNGDIVVAEYNHAALTVTRYVLDNVSADDHKAPAVWIVAGRRPVVMWQSHGANNDMRYRIGSADGNLASLASAVTALHQPGGLVSYCQIHKITHLSDASQDTFWVFYRESGVGWSRFPMTVTQSTGAVAFGAKQVLLNFTDAYASVVDANVASGNQRLRVSAGRNPVNGANHPLYYFEIDCVTGAITSPVDTDFTANLSGTNLPIGDLSLDPAVAAPAANNSRRLFGTRPGPDAAAIAYADWADATPDAATYKMLTINRYGVLSLTATADHAEAAYHASLDDTAGFDYRIALKMPASVATFGVGSRRTTGVGWECRITSANIFAATIELSTGQVAHSAGLPVAAQLWGGAAIGFRIKVDTAEGKLRRYYALNPLDAIPTWVEIGAGLTITGTVNASTQPLQIANHSSEASFAPEVYWAELRNSGGTIVSAVDFRTEWTIGAPTFTDDYGRAWSLVGAASVIAQAANLATTTHGIAGPRFGYIVGSNYIAGMSFENPSTAGAVLVAKSASGLETVERHRGTTVEPIAAQLTTQGRLARPVAPVGGGPVKAVISKITSYSATTTTEYAADLEGTPQE